MIKAGHHGRGPAGEDCRRRLFAALAVYLRASELGLSWRTIGGGLGNDYILHLAVDPADDAKLYAVTYSPRTRKSSVLASRDGGRSWLSLGSTTK